MSQFLFALVTLAVCLGYGAYLVWTYEKKIQSLKLEVSLWVFVMKGVRRKQIADAEREERAGEVVMLSVAPDTE